MPTTAVSPTDPKVDQTHGEPSLTEMMAEYATLKFQYNPILTRLDTLEKGIKAHVKESGETCPGIIIGKTYSRTNWHTGQLLDLSAQCPEILACKTETAVTPIRLDWQVAFSC